jgi:hypothetical protein
LLASVGGLLPSAIYWQLVSRVPSVTPEEALADKTCPLDLCRLKYPSGETQDLPFRESSLLEQSVTLINLVAVKPLYTLLSLVLIVVLWRCCSPDLAALRWAMVSFFVGENCCAANFLLFNERSEPVEFGHSYGMMICFGMTTFAILEGMDRRLFRLSDQDAKCAAVGLCQGCIKYADVPCGLKRLFLLVIPALMVLCLVPLTAEPIVVSYNTRMAGSLYNWSHPVVRQLVEIRYSPAAALVLLAVSLGVLRFKKTEAVLWSKVFFAAGMGALGFSYFRLIFFQVYRENLTWFNAWEELTELLFIGSIGLVLWIFRRGLFIQGARSKPLS